VFFVFWFCLFFFFLKSAICDIVMLATVDYLSRPSLNKAPREKRTRNQTRYDDQSDIIDLYTFMEEQHVSGPSSSFCDGRISS
jgi:hypothetical protein